MLLGDRSMIDAEDRAAFNRLGIAHILSMSGFHVGILAAMLMLVLKKASPRFRLCVTGLVLAFYCLLTGGHVPVIRAGCLVLISQYGRMKNRRVDTRWVLCAAFIITLMLCPAQLVSAGFHMTYGAVLGLSIVSRALQRLSPLGSRPVGKAVWQSFAASAGAQFGILLPQLYWFQQLPLISLILNMAVIPFGSLLIGCLWVNLLLCLWMPAAQLFGHVTSFLTDILLGAVRLTNTWPVMMLWTRRATLLTALMWAGMLLVLCVSWRGRKKRMGCTFAAMAMVLCLSLCPLPHHGTEYIQLSVGNADAAILRDENTVTVIDTGEDGSAVSDYLHAGRLSVDHLILTHLHMDHLGGAAALLQDGIPIRRVYIPEGAETAGISDDARAVLAALRNSGAEIVAVSRGDTLMLPSGTLQVLWPEKGRVRPGQDANSSSLVLRAELRGSTMLLTGDVDGDYEHYAAAPADILKVAHHGSYSSTGPAFVQAVSPRAAILSGKTAGRIEKTKERLGCPVYATGERGAVTVVLEEGGFRISTVK
ncbi:MAG: DNA internalization-related competence protein ComEC/Rec2 [Clostridia bacterium]|nr:DNA internalization-related competence protein ComEC/Rec2 [Clostridia bacterium]